MKNETFCALLASRIAKIRAALREMPRGPSRGESGRFLRSGRPQEGLDSVLEGVDRRLAELSALCPTAAQGPPGPDEAAREALSRVLAEIGGRRGGGLLPDSLSWVSG
ncbi:MAG: hypothetical protein WHT06_05430 [Desulfobacterales bacterium]